MSDHEVLLSTRILESPYSGNTLWSLKVNCVLNLIFGIAGARMNALRFKGEF